MKRLIALLVLWSSTVNASGLESIAPRELFARMEGDARAIAIHREGLMRTVAFAKSRNDVFLNNQRTALPSRESKEIARSTWASFLEYQLALDSTRLYYSDFHTLENAAREKAFLLHYAAFAAQYRSALDLVERLDGNEALDVLLNEPLPQSGVGKGSFAELKFRYLNVARATELTALETIRISIGGSLLPDVRRQIDADRDAILRHGKGKGQLLTAKNAFKVAKATTFSAVFPVQAGISEWMGDTRVARVNRSLITRQQIEALTPKLEPGDILIERREWYLSNIGLPGYWPHVAFYIGTPEERKRYFDDAGVREWAASKGATDFDNLLRSSYATAYAHHLEPENGHPTRIIEAISEGVVFTSIEHSADADAVAVLRPRLSRKDKAIAIARAFAYAGRPYDFNFDFVSDDALVCTELVYKAFEPSSAYSGLRFPVVEILGRQATPANEIVRMFDADHGSPRQQFDLIAFLDGNDRLKKAVPASEAAFRESWKRPKWHTVAAK